MALILLTLVLAGLIFIIWWILRAICKMDDVEYELIGFWYVVDEDGSQKIFKNKPVLNCNAELAEWEAEGEMEIIDYYCFIYQYLPKMTWEDDPLFIKIIV